MATRIDLCAETRVLVDLRAAGPLRAVGHSPTLAGYPDPISFDIPEIAEVESYRVQPVSRDPPQPSTVDVPVRVRLSVRRIALPHDVSPSDRKTMRDNLLGRDVLDEARFPTIDYAGRYAGTLEGGTLTGELHIRGSAHGVGMDIRISRNEDKRVAKGTWEGTLTGLGIKPYRALFGALRLEDWVRLRVEAWLSVSTKSC